MLTSFKYDLFLNRFFVVIILLNVLIAVVSDSYSYAKTKARQLFLRSRLELIAELDALGLSDEVAPCLPYPQDIEPF
jgi:hypothetical protein